MPLLSGRPSFTRLQLPSSQASPSVLDHELIEQFNDNAFVASDIGVPLEREVGWVSPEHLLDTDITYEKLAYSDGAAAVLGLRVDTNKVTPEIRRAVRAQHEQAARIGDADAKLSRSDKAEAKAQADAELSSMLADGRFRRPSLTEALWMLPERSVLLSTTSQARIEALCDQWRTTFGSGLLPESAGTRAFAFFEAKGRNADFDDLRPTRFTARPAGFRADADYESPSTFGDDPDTPVVPWAAASPEPRDFLGNEFLLWLWYLTAEHEGMLKVTDPVTEHSTTLAVSLHTAIETDCAWGHTGRMVVRECTSGAPVTSFVELPIALATGKLPRKAGIYIADTDSSKAWSCTLQADRWAVSGVVLPPVDDPFESPRAEREYRIQSTLELDRLLCLAFDAFLTDRSGDGWQSVASRIRAWIQQGNTHNPTGNAHAVLEHKPVPAHAQSI